jgi:hypothetical protein
MIWLVILVFLVLLETGLLVNLYLDWRIRMSTQPGLAALTQAVTDLTGAVASVAAELTTLLNELKAAIAASPAAEDAAVATAAASLETQIGALNAAVSGAKSGDPTPPVAGS